MNRTNKFTLALHNKGWTAKEACEHWGINYQTFNRRCNNKRFWSQLKSMINGLEDK